MTATYFNRKSADYSPYVMHFCKDTTPSSGKRITVNNKVSSGHPLSRFISTSGKDKLKSILMSKTIYASPLPHLPNNPPACCFTECVWGSLPLHVSGYGKYGVGVKKDKLFNKGGGPALYLRGDRWSQFRDVFPEPLLPFVTPFDPNNDMGRGIIDFIHEREWRVAEDFIFDYAEVEFVIVPTLQDFHEVSSHIGTGHIVDNKFIVMDNYDKVKKLWP